jgi:methionyl-tRNA formyltransferase
MKKKIILFGRGKSLFKLVKLIIEKNEIIIAGVVPLFSKNNKYYYLEHIISLLKKFNIKIYRQENINDIFFINRLRKLKIDLLCNWGYNKKFGESLIHSSFKGCLNYHPGLIPYGRGSGAIQGEIINKANFIGHTAHLMDNKYDAGNIIAQKKIKISGYEYFNQIIDKLEKTSVVFFYKAILVCLKKKKLNLKKNNSFGRYFPKLARNDLVLDWNLSSDEIVIKIRSRSPENSSITYLVNEKKFIYIKEVNISHVKNYKFVNGQVIDRDIKKGILVKTQDNAIWIPKISFDNKKFITPDFKIGTYFFTITPGLLLEVYANLKKNIKNKYIEGF